MADQHCPLNPYIIDALPSQVRMNLARVIEIEHHVSSAGFCIHPPLKDVILHGSYDGSSPLLLACDEGHFDAVKHIIEEWGTNVNAAAIYYHSTNREKIKGATPIFVAAHQGHREIVEYLISKGADVSAVTSTDGHSFYASVTPLHAALMWRLNVYDQSYSEECVTGNIIVRILLDAGSNPSALASDGTPVGMMTYCGVDATIALVKYGLDLNLRNWEGKSILHYWNKSHYNITEEERLKVVRLLVDSGADLNAQDNSGFTPILTSAESKSFGILDFLLENNVIDRNQKIDAMELVCSQLLLDTDPDDLTDNQEKACGYFRQALRLREESPTIIKMPLLMRSGQTVEWVTSEDLENVIEEPWIQCMLTRLRIYSRMSLEAVDDFMSSHYFFYLDLDSDEYEEDGRNIPRPAEHSDQNIVILLMGYLEAVLDIPSENPSLWMRSALEELVHKFMWLECDDPLLNVENMEILLQLISAAGTDGQTSLSYVFFTLLAGLPLALHHNIRKYLSQLARQDAGTWISTACHTENWDIFRLLLHLGADPTTVGWFGLGNLALHVLAERDETPVRSTAANLLFYYGANPNQMNDQGESAVGIWLKKNCGEESMQSAKWNDRPDWCRDTVPKISRLCVKTVHIHGVPFDEEHASLPPFQELPKSV